MGIEPANIRLMFVVRFKEMDGILLEKVTIVSSQS